MDFNDFNNTLKDFGTIIVNNDAGEPQIVHYPSINFYGCSFNLRMKVVRNHVSTAEMTFIIRERKFNYE